MANGFNKIFAKSAVKAHNKFDLSRSHLTTLNIGQIIPIFNEEVVPGDVINVDASYFARLQPLNKPTYGKMDFKTATMYVPYHQVAEDAEAYFAGKTIWQGQTPRMRHFLLRDVLNMFVDSASYTTMDPLCTVTTTAPTWYDFQYRNASGVASYGIFTPLGKYVYKFLLSLGYNIPEDGTLQTSDTWYSASTIGNGAMKLSAYPLLATVKAWNDWMSQSQRYNNSFISTLLCDIRQNRSSAGYYTNTTGNLTSLCLYKMLTTIVLSYENDYFTSAWQYPNNPQGSAITIGPDSVTKVTFISGDPYQGDYQDDFANQVATGTYTSAGNKLYQRELDFLKAFDDWVRRNNYAGSRDVQQVYARFGIKSDDYKTHFSEVCGTSTTPIQVGDVTATSKYSGQILGDYAGKGIINSDGKFTVKCSDFGLVVTLAWIAVRPMMPYGFDRKVLKSDPLDWFNPEFDAIGPQAISYMEVFENVKNDHLTHEPSGTVFGFTERYNEYKYGRDQVTGDFRIMEDMDTWHFGRDLTDVRNGSQMYAQTTSMNTIPVDSDEYLRVFAYDDADEDHFFITAYFNVNATRPMLNLSQAARLGDGDTVIAKNGNTLN